MFDFCNSLNGTSPSRVSENKASDYAVGGVDC